MLHFKKSIQTVMKERRSCRKFSDEKISTKNIELLSGACQKLKTSKYSFEIDYSNRYKKFYLLGVSNSHEKKYLDFAYAFEELILLCTDLNLKTCWTGVFPSSHFHDISKQSSFQSIDIVSPVGHGLKEPAEKHRKPWKELFFNKTTMIPLDRTEVGMFEESLDMIQIAPSAMNLQPWRILYEKNAFHFCLARSSGIVGFGMEKSRVDFQMIDMGIAISHFDLTNKENHLSGQWIRMPDIVLNPQWEYVISFTF